MGLGFLLAFFQLPGFFLQNLDGGAVLFRLRQALEQGQCQGGIGDGGDGQALPAHGLAQLILGEGEPDALLLRAGGVGLGSAPVWSEASLATAIT